MEKVRRIHIPNNKILNIEELTENRSFLGLWMHEITYKRENLIKMNYRQKEGISYTDVQWGFTPLLSVKKVYYTDLLVYMYLIDRPNQTTDKQIHKKKFAQEFMCTSAMLEDLTNYTIRNEATKKMMMCKMIARIDKLYKTTLAEFQDTKNETMLSFDKEFKEKSTIIYKATNRKLLSTPFFPFPYIYIWRKKPQSCFLSYLLQAYKRYKHI